MEEIILTGFSTTATFRNIQSSKTSADEIISQEHRTALFITGIF
jgi:hypothetical protein